MVFEVIGTSGTALTGPTVTEPAMARAGGLDPAGLDTSALDALDALDALEALDAPALDAPALDTPALEAPALDAGRVTGPSCPPVRSRPMSPGAVSQLLRSAVSLQAEGVLRTAGALAGSWGCVLDRTEWIERDARDLGVLAAVAVAAQVPLPAGVDTGAGDPRCPGSVVESLLAGHEALVRVLRQLDEAPSAGEPDGGAPWRGAVREVLARREEEMVLLRAVGACGDLPADERYRRGRPPRV